MTQPSLSMLIGKAVSHTWFGDYAALYLEIGDLTEGEIRRDGSCGNPIGEITLYAGFDWRIERKQSILGGSKNSTRRRLSLSNKLIGASIISAELLGRIPELQLTLSNSLWLVTFNSYNGQPDWSVSFNSLRLGHLCVERGRLSIDRRHS